MTLDRVGANGAGHVRLAGERWLAVSAIGTPIAPNTPALVTAVEGTTLLVLPVESLGEGIQP